MELNSKEVLCIYCFHKTYNLSCGNKKCSNCKRKFSLKKHILDMKLISLFIDSTTALQSSKILNISYQTTVSRYKLFRHLLAKYLEDSFDEKYISEFEEYLYLEETKKIKHKDSYSAKNFITFDCNGKIYNLLMPTIKRFKPNMYDSEDDEKNYLDFYKFQREHKIAKLKKSQNNITRFWEFFEENIKMYKGVKDENFIFYLKEFEFKFNYTKKEQEDILKKDFIQYYL